LVRRFVVEVEQGVDEEGEEVWDEAQKDCEGQYT
jgi:hypothetical protein